MGEWKPYKRYVGIQVRSPGKSWPKAVKPIYPPTPLPSSNMGVVGHDDDGMKARRSDVQLGAAPVPALCVVLW